MTWRPSPTYVPTLRDDLHWFDVAGDVVVLDLENDTLHHLNATAAAVGLRCDGDVSVGDLASYLTTAFGLDPSTASTAVNDVVTSLRQDGLLTDRDVLVAVDRDDHDDHHRSEDLPSDARRPDHPPPARGTGPLTGPFAALDFVFTIESDGGVGEDLIRVCDPLRSAANGSVVPVHEPSRYQVETDTTGPVPVNRLWLDGTLVYSAGIDESLTMLLTADIAYRARMATGDELLLHAGAVFSDRDTVLLVGEAETGKTTLTTACVADGWGYATDEIVAIDPERLDVRPFPRTLVLEHPALLLFADQEHARIALPPGTEDREWRMDPRLLRGDRPAGSTERTPAVSHVVIPHFVPGADTTMVGISTMQAFLALAEARFANDLPTEAGVEIAARLATAATSYELVFGDARDAARHLSATLGFR